MQNVEQEIARSSKTSTIAAGHPKKGNTEQRSAELIDAINQVFSLFRINFHNQYYAAYTDGETLNQAKRMWLQSLQHFKIEAILQSAKKVIESSEYLPTLYKFLTLCDEIAFSLPSARDAYLEACLSTEPRENYSWSHPIVYHAGKAAGWFFLRSQPESKTFPIFERHFNNIAQQVREEKELSMPEFKQIEKKKTKVLSEKEFSQRMSTLKETLGL